MNIDRRKIISYLLIAVLIIVAFVFVRYLFLNGRVAVELPQGNGKTVEIKSSSYYNYEITDETVFNLTLPAGEYTITTSLEENSYIEIISVGRFLTETYIDSTLMSPQLGRVFKGDEPRSCKYLLEDDFLLSYPCGGSANGMVYHRPASSSTPTYTSADIFPKIEGSRTIEGLISVSNKDYALLRTSSEFGVYHELHSLKTNGGKVVANFEKEVDFLTEDTYKIEYTDNKIIIYSESKIFEGTSLENMQEYSIETPIDSGATGSIYNSNRYVFTTVETFGKRGEITDTQNRVDLYLDGEKISKVFKGNYSSFVFCGDFLCTTNENILEIYDLNLKLKHTILDVDGFEDLDRMRLVYYSGNEVKMINYSDLKGSVVFKNSAFTINSVDVLKDKIYLTVNSGNKNHGLLLFENSTEYPDSYFDELFSSVFVKTISIYGNKVFISPELGEQVYSPSTCRYEYVNAIRIKAKDTINNLIVSSGLIDEGFNVTTNLVNIEPEKTSICGSPIQQSRSTPNI